MQDIYKIKEISAPFNSKEKEFINYLFSEYWYASENPNISVNKLSVSEKYFYLFGMISVKYWNK